MKPGKKGAKHKPPRLAHRARTPSLSQPLLSARPIAETDREDHSSADDEPDTLAGPAPDDDGDDADVSSRMHVNPTAADASAPLMAARPSRAARTYGAVGVGAGAGAGAGGGSSAHVPGRLVAVSPKIHPPSAPAVGHTTVPALMWPAQMHSPLVYETRRVLPRKGKRSLLRQTSNGSHGAWKARLSAHAVCNSINTLSLYRALAVEENNYRVTPPYISTAAGQLLRLKWKHELLQDITHSATVVPVPIRSPAPMPPSLLASINRRVPASATTSATSPPRATSSAVPPGTPAAPTTTVPSTSPTVRLPSPLAAPAPGIPRWPNADDTEPDHSDLSDHGDAHGAHSDAATHVRDSVLVAGGSRRRRRHDDTSGDESHGGDGGRSAAPMLSSRDLSRLTRTIEIFYFPFGVVVFWGMESEDEETILQSLARNGFQTQPVQDSETDSMEFTFGESFKVYNDKVTLCTADPEEKLAVSYALAQSVLLTLAEERVARTIDSTSGIPIQLARTGKISLTQRDIAKKIGELFIQRNSVNLTSDLLDTPAFFWDADTFEPTYDRVVKYLDLSNRIDVLNSRLDIIRELLDILGNQLENQHASKLEIIIIWLIVIEVVIEVLWDVFVKDVFHLVSDC